jgi:hypothetical protein
MFVNGDELSISLMHWNEERLPSEAFAALSGSNASPRQVLAHLSVFPFADRTKYHQ